MRGTTIEIDGGSGEGGGQIVRTALSLSALTGVPFHIRNIRANRPKPGLRRQHVAAARAVGEISSASVDGDSVGSRDLLFRPSTLKGGVFTFDIGTAGAVSLVLQALLPPLVFAGRDSHVLLKGGTHVPISPPIHFVQQVFLPAVAPLGVRASCSLGPYGFYPKGGGRVEAYIRSRGGEALASLAFPQTKSVSAVEGISAVANLPLSIAERQRTSVFSVLKNLGIETKIDVVSVPSPGQGTFVFLLAEGGPCPAGFSSVGVRGKRAELVGAEAADELLAYLSLDGCLDPHLSDQIVLYLALAKGTSSFTTTRITPHLLTNVDIIRSFLDIDFNVEGKTGGPGRVFVTGVGYGRT